MPERLTEKHIVDNIDCGYKIKKDTCKDGIIQGWNKTDAINKLGKLEDVEEELGINLDTFIKVLKSKNLVGHFNKYGQYDKKAIRKLRNIKLDIIKKRFLADDYGWVINIPLNFNKYGKTWATTKEELL